MFRRKSIPTDEAELVDRARKDPRHFGPLYELYFERIFRFIYKRVSGNEEISDELTQQTFIKAMGAISKYEDRGLPFSAWMFRIAQNEVNAWFRSLKKNYYVEVSETRIAAVLDDEGGSHHWTQEDLEKLINVLNELPEEHAELIELRFFQEMSFAEIATIYGITEPNAKMRIYRLLEKIRLNWNRES